MLIILHFPIHSVIPCPRIWIHLWIPLGTFPFGNWLQHSSCSMPPATMWPGTKGFHSPLSHPFFSKHASVSWGWSNKSHSQFQLKGFRNPIPTCVLGDRGVFLYQPAVPQFNSTLTLSMENIKSHILRAQSYRTAAPPDSDVSHKPML